MIIPLYQKKSFFQLKNFFLYCLFVSINYGNQMNFQEVLFLLNVFLIIFKKEATVFSARPLILCYFPQQFLYFFPEPHEVNFLILSILSIFIILLIFLFF